MQPGNETILRALEPIASRQHRRSAYEHLVAGACWILAALLAYQILRAFFPDAVFALRIALAAGVLVAIGFTAQRMHRQLGLADAATEADERANLKDELKSAYWFSQRSERNPLIDALLRRAEGSAAKLNAQAIVPSVMPRRLAWAAGLAVVSIALAWWSPRLNMAKALIGTNGVVAQGAAGEASDSAKVAARNASHADKLAKAAENIKGAASGATPGEEGTAKDAAQLSATIDGKAGDNAQAWANLERAVQNLPPGAASQALADAIKARDAKRAAKLLAELEKQHALAQADPSTQAQLNMPFANKGEGFVPKLQDLFKQQDDPFDDPKNLEEESAEKKALREATNKVAKLDEGTKGSMKSLRHEEAYSASIGKDSVIEASRYGERAPFEDKNGTGSQESGQAQMKGGVMHRRAAMTRGDPDQDGGSRVGEAEGDSKGDPMIGKQTQRLKAQLKRVDIDPSKKPDTEEGDSEKFFAATRQHESALAYADVARRSQYVSEDSTSGERVPLTYRTVVKDYFVNLRQKEK